MATVMSAVRHIDMGFYSVMGVACNKNRGYRSEVIMPSGLKTGITVVSKMVQF